MYMRIAIVGTGISGLVAAYLLSDEHDVVLYEANDYIGGHTHTHDVALDGRTFAVDTGFIVFNEKTYPNFVRLMNQLGVTWQDSNMSFGVKCAQTGLEFSPSTLNALFAQRRNIFRPAFYRMVLDALRFRREALELFETDRHYGKTLDRYLSEKKYSRWFIDFFIVPMGSAIWSADPDQFRQFPARYFAEFFHSHGFLEVKDQPQWLVIKGGSSQYIEPLTRACRDRIRLKCPVQQILRHDDHVTIKTTGMEPEPYDNVVIATHSDQALALLGDPSDKEREILGAIPYQENETVLHTDHSLLPKRRAAWAAWNYHIPEDTLGRVAVTYNMNILQSLPASKEFCVTLNMTDPIDPSQIIKALTYHHPVYSPTSLAARQRYDEINGENRTYYCGAYWFYGFHEDGVKSGLAVGERFGKRL
jgi:predicted NAD/FAD-binding protein